MPRPAREDILKDTELLSIVGAINIEWDEIEIALWRIFWKILKGPWHHSYAIFYSQQNHRARREMLESLALAAMPDGSAELRKIKALLGRVKRAATKRNEISHGLWDKEDKSAELLRRPLKRKYTENTENAYSKSDLKALQDQLTKLSDDLFAYYSSP